MSLILFRSILQRKDPVQTPVLNGFSEVGWLQAFRVCQIGNGSCNAQNSSVGSCRETKPIHGLFEQFFSLFVKGTVFFNVSWLELGIGEKSVSLKATGLLGPCRCDSFANGEGGFRRSVLAQF